MPKPKVRSQLFTVPGVSFDDMPDVTPGNIPGFNFPDVCPKELNMCAFQVHPRENGIGQAVRVAFWREDGKIKLPLCPWNLGGDSFNLDLPFELTRDHYTQSDKSLNRRLWAEHPWDLSGDVNEMSDLGKLDAYRGKWKKVDTDLEKRLWKATARNRSNYSVTAPLFERLFFARNLLSHEFLLDTLKMHGFLDGYEADDDKREEGAEWRRRTEENKAKVIGDGPKPVLPPNYGTDWVHPRIRKANNTVEPVKALVKRVKAKKKIVTTVFFNGGDPIRAVLEYSKLLMELYPWVASPLFFSNNDAFLTGIAPLESDLWVQLGLSCIRALRLTNHFRFATGAVDCGNAILNMRYTTYTALSKACFMHHEAFAFRSLNDPKTLNQIDQLHDADCVKAINSYILGHAFRIADNKDGAWAHKKCYAEHVCSSYQGEGYRVSVAKFGHDAIIMPLGWDFPLFVKTDPSVNDDY